MYDALRDDEPFSRCELHDTLWRDAIRGRFQIDQKASFDDVEELVVISVLMPVILPLHDAKPNDGIIDASKGLVVPRIEYCVDERVERDLLEWREEDVEMRGVRKARQGQEHSESRLQALMVAEHVAKAVVKREDVELTIEEPARAIEGDPAECWGEKSGCHHLHRRRPFRYRLEAPSPCPRVP